MKFLSALLFAMMLALSQAVTLTELDSSDVSEPIISESEEAAAETLASNDESEEIVSEVPSDEEIELLVAEAIDLMEEIFAEMIMNEEMMLEAFLPDSLFMIYDTEDVQEASNVSEPIIEEIVDEPESVITETQPQTIEAAA